MEHAVDLAVGTITLRPYVFAFLSAYIFASVLHLGWRKTLLFTVAGYAAAFASEYSSIHTGFPYGRYYYVETTRAMELWVAGVPFFDSISFVFLSYCSYATALLIVSPVKAWRGNLVLLETMAIRGSRGVLVLAALLQTSLDMVIDPVALRGDRWFLGRIYGYGEVGVHFGVPLTNYGGWFLTSLLLVWLLQAIDARSATRVGSDAGMSRIPFRALFGPLLYLSVLLFNLAVTLSIGESLMAVTGLFSYLLPVGIVGVLLTGRVNRFTPGEMEDHLRDFPRSPANAAPR